MDVFERMSFFARLYRVGEGTGESMWYLYVTIVIFSIIVYRLGFAKKLKRWMNIIIYFLLATFCLLLTFFAVFLPITEVLAISSIVLGIYKIRLRRFMEKESVAK